MEEFKLEINLSYIDIFDCSFLRRLLGANIVLDSQYRKMKKYLKENLD